MNNVLNYIAKDIQTKMTRFGIVADFRVKEAPGYDKIVSSDFIMQPMIFKDIHAEGIVYFTLSEGDGTQYTDIDIVIKLRYNHWNGGQNGFDFARFKYYLRHKDYMEGNVKGMECEQIML